MLTDAHCHPFDLAQFMPSAEQQRRQIGVLAAASSCDLKEFSYNEILAKETVMQNSAPLLPCFAVHPQQLAMCNLREFDIEKQLSLLEELAKQKRIFAVGECGFDLYNTEFKKTEKMQEKVFAFHLETAVKYELPVVLHVRRGAHKIFAAAKDLAKCKAVVFHSCPLSFEETQSLLRRKVNAYFSYGNAVINGHKQMQRSFTLLPAERLLTETDAPYQPARGEKFSQWTDLPRIIEKAAILRNENAKELESQIEKNFRTVFGC
jgi:TatD DNase family protein